MTFCLNECKSIGIYGYNERAEKIKKYLEHKGVKNIFFIDKNAVNISKENVFGVENLENTDVRSLTIIISLQNAVVHKEISEKFYKMGIDRIIFLPMGINCSSKETTKMRKYYNELIECIADIKVKLPIYQEIVFENKIKNVNGIIDQDDKFTTFWMNIRNLYVNDNIKHPVKLNEEYYGKPIILLKHFQALFKFLENGEDNEWVEKYMTSQGYKKRDGSYDEERLAGRYELWNLYKEELNKGMDFFCSSPIKVKPNQQGAFNIVDGSHRTTFLYMQNLMYIPITLRTEVFEEMYSEKELRKLVDYMEKKGIYKLCTPIEHPAFYGFPCEKEKQEPSVLSSIQKYIGTADIEAWDMLDISDYNSYFARMMSKRRRKPGKGRIWSVETEEEKFMLAKYINEAMHIKNVELVLENNNVTLSERKYDIVFALGRWSGERYSERIIRLLDQATKNILFWESNLVIAEEEIHKILKSTSFKQYKMIFRYFDGMQCKNVYAIQK